MHGFCGIDFFHFDDVMLNVHLMNKMIVCVGYDHDMFDTVTKKMHEKVRQKKTKTIIRLFN